MKEGFEGDDRGPTARWRWRRLDHRQRAGPEGQSRQRKTVRRRSTSTEDKLTRKTIGRRMTCRGESREDDEDRGGRTLALTCDPSLVRVALLLFC
jgi:hypothetical protein